jgi:hypothetical protein
VPVVTEPLKSGFPTEPAQDRIARPQPWKGGGAQRADVRGGESAIAPGTRTWPARAISRPGFGLSKIRLAIDAGLTPRFKRLASATGYGILAFTIAWALANKGLGADLTVWDRVGDQVRQGISPYYPASINVQNFFYAPPIALLFAAVSWLPVQVLALAVFAVELAALRYVAGSWLRVGYLGLIPITGGELAAGQFNLVIAAGLAATLRGDPRLAVVGALAKLSPVLAIRDWRRAAPALAVLALVTLPVAGWWLDWAGQLAYGSTLELGYPVPIVARLAVAIGLVAFAPRSRRTAVLAAAIAIPGLYSYALVLLYPLLMDANVGAWIASWRALPGVGRRRVPAFGAPWSYPVATTIEAREPVPVLIEM